MFRSCSLFRVRHVCVSCRQSILTPDAERFEAFVRNTSENYRPTGVVLGFLGYYTSLEMGLMIGPSFVSPDGTSYFMRYGYWLGRTTIREPRPGLSGCCPVTRDVPP